MNKETKLTRAEKRRLDEFLDTGKASRVHVAKIEMLTKSGEFRYEVIGLFSERVFGLPYIVIASKKDEFSANSLSAVVNEMMRNIHQLLENP